MLTMHNQEARQRSKLSYIRTLAEAEVLSFLQKLSGKVCDQCPAGQTAA